MAILRSWFKQERAASRNSRWGSTLRIGTLLLITVVGLEGARRLQATQSQLEQRQLEHLELLQSLVRDSGRALSDWAHWDDTYAYLKGRNPSFISHDMATTSLLDDGAVMALFNGSAEPMALEGAGSRDRSPRSPLSRCLAEEERNHGIRVSTLTLGAVNTPLWDSATVHSSFDRRAMLAPERAAEALVSLAQQPASQIVEDLTLMPAAGAL